MTLDTAGRTARATAALTCLLLCWQVHMLFGDAHYLVTRVLHFDLTRDQADQRPADQHQAAHPDPGYQRVDEGLNHGALVIVGHATEIDIQVLIGAHADGDSDVLSLLALNRRFSGCNV